MAVFESSASSPVDTGRGSYDTTGTSKPPPKPKATESSEDLVGSGRGSYDTTGTAKPPPKPTK
ncbi:Uu.00g041780.m01.CDS01 [Anthostomella pinea]|uniref:Uu.00g041780.m01.CDS01 n=1 Tax=Anthostomella pinea TaxID=933095 RepID=A0AAI8VBE6_9PEZI|nr:Uu.00g041780.m01.CDS01 [Anthostomella pinea]